MKEQDKKYQKFIKWLKKINNIHIATLENNHNLIQSIYEKL